VLKRENAIRPGSTAPVVAQIGTQATATTSGEAPVGITTTTTTSAIAPLGLATTDLRAYEGSDDTGGYTPQSIDEGERSDIGESTEDSLEDEDGEEEREKQS
jgi:hypothetical protein